MAVTTYMKLTLLLPALVAFLVMVIRQGGSVLIPWHAVWSTPFVGVDGAIALTVVVGGPAYALTLAVGWWLIDRQHVVRRVVATVAIPLCFGALLFATLIAVSYADGGWSTTLLLTVVALSVVASYVYATLAYVGFVILRGAGRIRDTMSRT